MFTELYIEALFADKVLADTRRIGSDVVVDIGGLEGDYSAN
jgi:hypothetical protein